MKVPLLKGNQDTVDETLFTINANTQTQTKKEQREYYYGARGLDDIVEMKLIIAHEAHY